MSLLLEFVALVVLRITQPALPRPFRVPGGMFGVILVGVLPMLLLAFAVTHAEHEKILGISSFLFGTLMIAAGFAAYGVDALFAKRRR